MFANPFGHQPPRVDHTYRHARAMQADMDRYYEDCRRSPKGSGPDGKEYCARTAWMLLRKSGRYHDYPAFQRRAEHRPYAAPAGECGCSGNRSLLENPFEDPTKTVLWVSGAALVAGLAWVFWRNMKSAPAAGTVSGLPGVGSRYALQHEKIQTMVSEGTKS